MIKRLTVHLNRLPGCAAALALAFGLTVASPSAFGSEAAPHFTMSPSCPFPNTETLPADRTICGRLTVPVDWSGRSPGTISLPVIIFKARDGIGAQEPLVFLHGGPGGGPVGNAASMTLFSEIQFGQNRDIILYNQRGGLLGNPSLECATAQDKNYGLMAADLSYEATLKARTEAATACLKSLTGPRLSIPDFTALYGGEANARDLQALRQALKIKKWALFGISYGGHVAQNAARIDAPAITKILLDSPVPLDAPIFFDAGPGNLSDALKALFADCKATSCDTSFPNLEQTFRTLIQRLRERPVTVHLSDHAVPGGGAYVVNWHDFMHLIHWMLYNPQTLRQIPLLIQETAAGRTVLLAQMLENVLPTPQQPRHSAFGAFLATACGDRPASPDAAKLPGNAFSIARFLDGLCPTGRPAPVMKPVAAIPVLVLSGRYDPITPARYIRNIRAVLPQAIQLVSPVTGHAVLGSGRDCALGIATRFLSTVKPPADSRCLTEAAPVFASHAPREVTAESAEAWADAEINPLLAKKAISGAVVSVVRDGRIIMSKGYGIRDPRTGAAVDPARTRFLIGSVSKTFTGTLIAKLMDEGLIQSLDDPANRYLKRIRLPDNAGTPITLRHLVTHSAGFEDKFHHIGTDREIPVPVTAKDLYEVLPRYVRPAGHSIVYSNFGIAVLGAVIEDVTGQPISTVMTEKLFRPLGMTHTALSLSLSRPEHLGIPGMIDADGHMSAFPYQPISPVIAPAGAIVTTAEDMGRYMIGQMAGNLVSKRVNALLHGRITANGPGVGALGLTFFINDWNGEPEIGHGGNWPGFHSWISMLPDRRTGVFVSIMGAPAPEPVWQGVWTAMTGQTFDQPAVLTSAAQFRSSFLVNFLGDRKAAPRLDSDMLPPAAFAGDYRPDRRNRTTAEALADLLSFGSGVLRVDVNADNSLMVGGQGGWKAVGPGLFQQDEPAAPYLAFRSEADGSLSMTPDFGIYTFTRISQWQHPRLHAMAAILSFGVVMAGGILAAWRLRKSPARRLNLSVLATLALTLLVPLLIFAGLDTGTTIMDQVYLGYEERMIALLITVNLLIAAVLWMATENAAVLLGERRRGIRIMSLSTVIALAIVILAAACFCLVLAHYNLAGWHLP